MDGLVVVDGHLDPELGGGRGTGVREAPDSDEGAQVPDPLLQQRLLQVHGIACDGQVEHHEAEMLQRDPALAPEEARAGLR